MDAAKVDSATLVTSTANQTQLDPPTADTSVAVQLDIPPKHSDIENAATEPSISNPLLIEATAPAIPALPLVERPPLPAPNSAASPRALPTQRLVIKGVRENLGPVKVAIYTTASDFPNPDSALKTLILPAYQSELDTTLEMPCSFAIAVYQDINSDGDLNRNKLGIPVEPFAFSNNAMGRRGPPTFDQALVPVSANPSSPQDVIVNLP